MALQWVIYRHTFYAVHRLKIPTNETFLNINKGKIPKGICCLSLKAWNQIPAWLCQIGTNFRATGRNAACGVLCWLACLFGQQQYSGGPERILDPICIPVEFLLSASELARTPLQGACCCCCCWRRLLEAGGG